MEAGKVTLPEGMNEIQSIYYTFESIEFNSFCPLLSVRNNNRGAITWEIFKSRNLNVCYSGLCG
jgi:hypothetical protein